MSQQTLTRPALTQPAPTQPTQTEPAAVTQPAVTQPPQTQPAVTQPAVTQPAVTQPAVTQPAVTQPTQTQPALTRPPLTRPALSRPTLLPGLRPLWRSPHAVQLGTDPGQAMVLEIPHPAAAKLLDLLDGSRTEQAIVAEMARLGLALEDTQKMLTQLIEAGLVVGAHTLMPPALPPELRDRIASEAAALALRFRERPATPAAILRRRYDARVIVAGEGALAQLLITTLAEAGVGTLGQVTDPGGTAKPVVSAGRSATVRTGDSFVVQIGWMSRVPQRGARGLPHLAAGVRDGVAIVGPLVPAGGGPCLRCLDLHRTDRDPAWPRLAAQLMRSPAPCAAATLHTAAGFAAAEVLAYLDGGQPTTVGTTVEINGVAPWRRRTWTTHPECGCTQKTTGSENNSDNRPR